MRPGFRRPRPADAARLGLAVALLARPGLPVRWTGSAGGPGVERTVRILGVRYLVQSTVGLSVRAGWLRRADSGVDVIHAASMLWFARAFPRQRRLALLSSLTALGFATLDLREQTR